MNLVARTSYTLYPVSGGSSGKHWFHQKLVEEIAAKEYE